MQGLDVTQLLLYAYPQTMCYGLSDTEVPSADKMQVPGNGLRLKRP